MTSVQTQQNQTYTLDPTHSTVEFVVRHMMISKVRGRFAGFTGRIDVAPGSDLPAAVSATIDAASVDTREEQRDAHLRSGDFFDAQAFPSLTFESTRIEGSPQDFKIYGKLSIHGVTKDVVLDAEFEGSGNDPWGGQRVAYSARTTINRKDFGLNWNAALEAGGVLVSDEVKIELNVQAVLQK